MPDESPRSNRGASRGTVVIGGALVLLFVCWAISGGDLERGCLRLERTLGSVIAAAGAIWLVVQMLDRAGGAGVARPHALVTGIVVVLAGVLLGSLAWAAALGLGVIGALLVLQDLRGGCGQADGAQQAQETRKGQGGGA